MGHQGPCSVCPAIQLTRNPIGYVPLGNRGQEPVSIILTLTLHNLYNPIQSFLAPNYSS